MPETADTSKFQVALARVLNDAIQAVLLGSQTGTALTDDILGDVQAAGEITNKVAAPVAAEIAASESAFLMALAPYVRLIVKTIIDLASPIAVQLLTTISKARNEAAGPVNELTVASLSELLGVELSADDIPAGGGLQGNAAKARAIGGKLHDLLIAEFAPTGNVTPESGEAAARAFTGFNINFAVSTAFNSMLGELFSLGAFKELGDVGIDVAQNLGLGRLHRAALKPLIDNTIAKPYDAELRKRYRPDSLTEVQLVKKLNRDPTKGPDVGEALARKGYKDEDIIEIIEQLTLHLSEHELELLVRHGAINRDFAVQQLTNEGYPPAIAELKVRARELAKVDTLVDSTIAEYRSLVKHRFMDIDTFRTVIDTFPIGEDQKVWEIRLAGAPLDFAHKRITLAQLFKMEEDGILDLAYFDEWCKAEGYSDDDTVNLQLLLFKTEQDIAAKAAAAKKRADAAAAKAADAAAKKAAKK